MLSDDQTEEVPWRVHHRPKAAPLKSDNVMQERDISHYRRITPAIEEGKWSEWGGWSHCSRSCGSGGTRTRIRYCQPFGDDDGEDDDEEEEEEDNYQERAYDTFTDHLIGYDDEEEEGEGEDDEDEEETAHRLERAPPRVHCLGKASMHERCPHHHPCPRHHIPAAWSHWQPWEDCR